MEPGLEDMIAAGIAACCVVLLGFCALAYFVVRHFNTYVYMSVKDTAMYFLGVPVFVLLLTGLTFRVVLLLLTRL
jgi:hypothetical protein